MLRKPCVKIIEQPRSRGTRFRYDSEGRIAGTITGVNSTREKKSYPTIQIMNHKGPAFVVVSCVSKDEPYRPHPYNISVKVSEMSQGIFYYKVPPNESVITFPYFGIECVKKKNIVKSLEERERLQVDPFKTGFDHKLWPEKIDLSSLRLCFQVFIEGKVSGLFNVPLDPVVTLPIYDRKATGDLKIWWISDYSAPISGGNTVCLLCEKIIKDDIQVRFYDRKTNWEATAEFTPPGQHKQVALVFKTPKYNKQDVDQPVQVHIQLRRPSDDEVSNSIPFEFIPVECASGNMLRAKRQKLHESPRDLVLRHLQEKAEQPINMNVNANTFPVENADSLGLCNPTVVDKPTQLSFYNEINMYRRPSSNRFTAHAHNHLYYNHEPIENFNQMAQNFTINNFNAMDVNNSNNNCPNYDQSYNNNELNEQRNQNFSYLDELVTSMMGQNYEEL